jgi:hypothetical protein
MDLSVTELRELTTVITALRLHAGDFPSDEH